MSHEFFSTNGSCSKQGWWWQAFGNLVLLYTPVWQALVYYNVVNIVHYYVVKIVYLSQALGNLVLLASEEPPEEAVQRPDLNAFVKMLKVFEAHWLLYHSA